MLVCRPVDACKFVFVCIRWPCSYMYFRRRMCHHFQPWHYKLVGGKNTFCARAECLNCTHIHIFVFRLARCELYFIIHTHGWYYTAWYLSRILCANVYCSIAQLYLMIILCIFGAHVFKFGFVQMDYLRTYLHLHIAEHRNRIRITFVSTKILYFFIYYICILMIFFFLFLSVKIAILYTT